MAHHHAMLHVHVWAGGHAVHGAVHRQSGHEMVVVGWSMHVRLERGHVPRSLPKRCHGIKDFHERVREHCGTVPGRVTRAVHFCENDLTIRPQQSRNLPRSFRRQRGCVPHTHADSRTQECQIPWLMCACQRERPRGASKTARNVRIPTHTTTLCGACKFDVVYLSLHRIPRRAAGATPLKVHTSRNTYPKFPAPGPACPPASRHRPERITSVQNIRNNPQI